MYSAVKYEHTRFSGLGELVHNCIGMCHVTIENYAKYCSFKIKARCLAQLIGIFDAKCVPNSGFEHCKGSFAAVTA